MTELHDRFFAAYRSTHLAHRDAPLDAPALAARARVYRRHFRALLPPTDARLLDCGCGDGSFLWWLAHDGWTNAEGIDLSGEQVAQAHALGLTRVTQADLRPWLADRPGHYDAILLRDVLEHFPKDAVVDILERVRAALRPGGRFILQVPNAESPFFGRIRYGDFTHELAFSVTSLQQLLNLTGFAEPQFHGTPPVPHGLRSLVQTALWRAVQAAYRLALAAELGRGSRIVTQGLIAVARRP